MSRPDFSKIAFDEALGAQSKEEWIQQIEKEIPSSL